MKSTVKSTKVLGMFNSHCSGKTPITRMKAYLVRKKSRTHFAAAPPFTILGLVPPPPPPPPDFHLASNSSFYKFPNVIVVGICIRA